MRIWVRSAVVLALALAVTACAETGPEVAKSIEEKLQILGCTPGVHFDFESLRKELGIRA